MPAEISSVDRDLTVQLSDIAARLIDIAGGVASEAEMATAVVRGMTDQAGRVATLAAGLEAAAGAIEASVRQQSDALALARTALSTNKPIVDALDKSIAAVAAISTTIGAIAQESRMLSLNARIEAARAGPNGKAFDVVATEISTLSTRTKSATAEIGAQAIAIANDVGAARRVVASHSALVLEQDELLATSLEHAMTQRVAAVKLAGITAETVITVEQAATAIGRVGANAVAVKVLARQLLRLGKCAG